MNPQSQSFTISAIDDELIYDTNHILMNYLKMNNFSPNCFSETNIQISKSILDSSISAEIKKIIINLVLNILPNFPHLKML